MSDARELLARLGPGAIKYDAVPGGTGDGLSGVDVAAALGMVPAGLGRDLLEYRCKCPSDRTKAERERITRQVVTLALTEWKRLQDERNTAELSYHLARVTAPQGREVTMETARYLARLEARAAMAAGAAWPKATPYRVHQLVDGLLSELCGEGVPTGADYAAALGLSNESGYRRYWVPVHDFLLAAMREAEEGAARRFAKATRKAA